MKSIRRAAATRHGTTLVPGPFLSLIIDPLLSRDPSFLLTRASPIMATDEDMEGVQVENKKRASVDIDNVKRKKFKADDLPLSGAQHAAIDKLLHSFKKKGGFDSVRKKIWAEFNEGVRSPFCRFDCRHRSYIPCRTPRPSLRTS